MSAEPDFAGQMEAVARLLLGEPNRALSKPTELRYGTNGSLSIDLQKGTFFDNEAKKGGGVFDLVRREKGTNGEAVEWMIANGFIEESKERKEETKYIERTYDYVDEAGALQFQAVRFGFKDAGGNRVIGEDGKAKKTFAQRRKAGGEWQWNLKGVRIVPYRLPELLEAAAHDYLIYIAEGEKAVDRLRDLGIPATCNPMGAGKWRDELSAHFKGANVVILRDNDKAGQDHGDLVADKLKDIASSIRVLDFEGVPEKGDVVDWLDAGHDAAALHAYVEAKARAPGDNPPPQPAIIATPFRWRDPRSMPPRQFVYGRHAIRGFVSVSGAGGGVGKTSRLLVEGTALGTGRELLGERVPAPVPVWYLGLEDPLEEYERRVMAIALYYGIPGPEIEAGLFLDSGRDQNFVIATEDRAGVKIAEPIVGAIVANIQQRNIGWVIVDPFVASHSVGENDNTRIEKVTREWARIAQVANCAVELVHHLRKGNGQGEASADDIRGGSAVVNAARYARILSQMTKEEASEANISERRRFFKATVGKANMFLPPEAAEWCELKTVSLGNGNGGPDDEVQVATRWTWPNALDGLHVSDLAKVQDKIASAEWAENSQAANWAGYAVAEALDLKLAEATVKGRVKSLLRTWIASGALKVERLHSTRDGRVKPMIVAGMRG